MLETLVIYDDQISERSTEILVEFTRVRQVAVIPTQARRPTADNDFTPPIPMSDSEPSEELEEFHRCPVPMWIYDLATLSILEVNDAAVRSYGYSRADFLRMSILDIRPREDILPVMRSALQDHPVTGKVWRHQKEAGTIIHVRVTSTEIKFQGRPARMVHAIEVTPAEVDASQSSAPPKTSTSEAAPSQLDVPWRTLP